MNPAKSTTDSPGTTAPAPTAPARPNPRLLLSSQLIFNIGFYSVVPFIAITMSNDFAMSAVAIGVVLGARTFAQQGMFLAGGAIADRWGARYTMVTGCLVRVTGYLLLAAADNFALFLAGAIVTGVGGALFSPALESLVAAAEERREPTAKHRPTLFASLVIVGEFGAVVGPLLGTLLLGFGFEVSLYVASAIFTTMAFIFWRFLPRDRAHGRRVPGMETQNHQLLACLRDKRFVAFACFFSVSLLAHNQLYFGLPVELRRSGLDAGALGFIFAYASILTVSLQWPIAKLMRRFGERNALTLGLGLKGTGFVSVAVLATQPPAAALEALPAVVLVTGLCLGNMCATPTAMRLVMDFADGRPTGAYYGLLASCGGAMVLVGNTAMGPLYQLAEQPSTAASSPWLFTAVLALVSAVAIRRFLPNRHAQDLA
ncbi:Nitrate/nitrite transporter NarK [Arthrobacter sp. yr096]|uniref:MFS transporter n=1 Tax=Arthrobacter sp. yr096 TaxID=1761750 RepID=UPI0008C56A98|nr:MFS transporter [Arthrobacter sp. yr096]SEI76408.1 Nitrate/nitrite transporter NarK [Arthrobacter sp. yr096]